MNETHRSSISHHEKMTDRLWEECARLKQKKTVLKAKLKAKKTEFAQRLQSKDAEFSERLESKDAEIAEVRGLLDKADLRSPIAEHVNAGCSECFTELDTLTIANRRISQLEAHLEDSLEAKQSLDDELHSLTKDKLQVDSKLKVMFDQKHEAEMQL